MFVQRMDSINVTRREVKGIIKDIEGIENRCFHQILSTADTSVFAQILYISAGVPFSFQGLGHIPWNSSQLTKVFLLEYADLICVEIDSFSYRLYDCHPGLPNFIFNPVRAGVYHHLVRSHFIQIIDNALECGYYSPLWDDASGRCVSLCFFNIN